MKSKTIILSLENEKGRGILTIYQEEDILQCRIRLYNITELSRYCKLGIYHNNQVYSANLLKKEGVYTSSMVGDFDIDQDFYAAIIDTNNNNKVLLCGGTYAGFFFNDQTDFENKINSNELNFKPANINNNFKVQTSTSNHVFDEIKKEDPSTNIYSPLSSKTEQDCEEDCERCKTCKYKEFFYSQNSFDSTLRNMGSFDFAQDDRPLTQSKDILRAPRESSETLKMGLSEQSPNNEVCENYSQTIKEGEFQARHVEQAETSPKQSDRSDYGILQQAQDDKTSTISESLKTQFKYVFENYPPDEQINSLLENAKFVKISEEEKSYSIGAIYENERMKYICYAVLCNYNSPVPEELGKHYQWLPLDREDPLSEGYYVVFQDAIDLKIVEL